MIRPSLFAALGCSALVVSACDSGTQEPTGPSVAIDVAALTLTGVADAVWDIEVVNGAATPQVVFQKRISSSRFGDGAGSASYVGPCDASAGAAENTAKLWVVGLYSAPVSTLGSFASGGSGGVVGTSVAFQNPTLGGPLTQTLTCAPNSDTRVRFDVSLMRPAEQGFFDIAVSFDDIFCSAKLDCCKENAQGVCASDLELLFDAAGERAATMVLGLACTAGTGSAVETNLYFDGIELDCSSPTAATFSPDFVISPAAGPGNACVAGNLTGCSAVQKVGALDPNNYFYQVGLYRGLEQTQSAGAAANVTYWNVALGVKHKVANGPGIEDCQLRTRATADDGLGSSAVDNGIISGGQTYPYLQWDAALGTCGAEPLTFGNPTAPVRTAYTGTGTTTFVYGYGKNVPASAFACGNGIREAGEGCDDGDRQSGDGCSIDCTVEAHFGCTGTAPSVCSCNEPDVFQWATFTSKTQPASTTVGGVTVSITNADYEVNANTLQNYGYFPAEYMLPSGSSLGYVMKFNNAGSRTVTFSPPVNDAILLFASLGQPNIQVVATLSKPFDTLYMFNPPATPTNPTSSHTTTTMTSTGGDFVVRLNGLTSTFNVSTNVMENRTNFMIGFSTKNALCPVVP